MEIVLLAVVFCTIFLLVAMRYFFKQMLEKLSEGSSTVTFKAPLNKSSAYVPGAKNEIDEPNPDEVEFSEHTPLDLPKDVKIEVEGGDSSVPPTYPKERIVNG